MNAKRLNIQHPLLVKKIPLPVTLLLLLIFAYISFLMTGSSNSHLLTVDTTRTSSCNENLNIIHLDKYNYISPLLLVEIQEESKLLLPVKQQIELSVNNFKEKGVKDFSVYLLKQNTGDWIGINNKHVFKSTGYIRLAIFIAYLKQAEENPQILEKKLWYSPPRSTSVNVREEVPTESLYPIKELMRIMLSSQDTTAKNVLIENINKSELQNLFKIVGLKEPDYLGRTFDITVSDYSKFLQLLYNANYLNKDDSEYALNLLNDHSGNKTGILKFLPADSKAIHKYSERFNNGQYEFRESGIIYTHNDSYLLTIFASGGNNAQLDSAAGLIGKNVYDYIAGM